MPYFSLTFAKIPHIDDVRFESASVLAQFYTEKQVKIF